MAVGRARAAVTAAFFLNGAVFSGWYARLPAITGELGLSPGEIGIALLGAPVGLLVAQPPVGGAIARRGSRALLRWMPVAFAAVVLPALAGDFLTLLAALLVVGAANGALDVAINAQGLAVERAAPRPLFASLHAAFSFGALAGAAAAGVVAGLGVDPLAHLAVAGGLGALTAAGLARGLLADDAGADPRAPRLARPTRRLAVLAAIAFCALLAEGAVFDWSALYLAAEAGAAGGLAALGLAAFNLTMGVGRLLADGAVARRGPVFVARLGAGLAALGLGLALAVPDAAAGIAGFALIGLGLAAVFPLALSATATAPELAAVSALGYTGFLAGPPLIGLLAEAASLRAALLAVCAACVLAGLLCGALAPARRRPAAA